MDSLWASCETRAKLHKPSVALAVKQTVDRKYLSRF